MVELQGVTVTYNKGMPNEQKALRDISLTVNEGEFVTIIGPNGAGKTTLLKVLLGEVSPLKGTYRIDGKLMNNRPPHHLARFIGRVYQDPNTGIFPSLSIKENLLIAAKKGFRTIRFSKLKKEGLDLLEGLGLGLEKRLGVLAGELSGGQKQSLAMIMAISSCPRLLLLDEHTAALDPRSAKSIMDLTMSINGEKGITVMMITHNMEFAGLYGRRLVEFHEGSLIKSEARSTQGLRSSVDRQVSSAVL